MSSSGGYPAQWEADTVLSDGGTVHVRPIRPDDAQRLQEFYSRLSPETVYNRFFSMMKVLSPRDLERFTTVDHDDRAALVATLRDRIVGVVRYARLPDPAEAEVAVVVEDAQQGRGLGALLLEHLEAAARERGVQRFLADVLPGNRRMLAVFRAAGFEIAREMADGYVELTFPIQETEATQAVVRSREHRAEARSVARLLSPKTVAVIGASREPGTAGHEIFRSLIAHGFAGPVYPVNRAAAHVLSVHAYPDIHDVPGHVDLAVVALPAPLVAAAVQACSDKNVRGLLVVSSGFGDAGEEGRARLAEIVRLARDGGMRLIGPNATGIVNTDPTVSLHATFAGGSPSPGRVGVFSHSGALAGTVLAEASRRSLGLSTFVSIGDRADVSGNDLLQYWQDDPATEVVLMHLQGFGNPRKFARIARLLGRTKPVVALKSGRGTADVSVDALFASAGVLRVDTLAQLFETAQLLVLQPLPAGRRVGIVGTSSALAALAKDACLSAGLEVPELSAGVRAGLRGLTGTTETGNPVDLGAQAQPEQLRTALALLAGSGEVDALLTLVTPQVDATRLAAVLLQTSVQQARLPVVTSYLGLDGVPPELATGLGAPGAVSPPAPGRGSVPSYASPEAAALALSLAASYAAWRARPVGEVPDLPDIDGDAARALVAELGQDGSWLPLTSAADLLATVGIAVWPTTRTTSLAEALAAAAAYGYPVVLKAAEDRWRNRTDVGAVRLALAGPDEVQEAWVGIQALLGSGGTASAPGSDSAVDGRPAPGTVLPPEVESARGIVLPPDGRSALGTLLPPAGEPGLGAVLPAVGEPAPGTVLPAVGEPAPVIVQPMAEPGVSTVVHLVGDPAVGPLLSLRLGGVAADLLADPHVRTLPLTDVDAEQLVAGIRGSALLAGTDTVALRETLLRVARLAEEVPELAELVLDPVLVARQGCVVLHAGVRLLPPGVDLERGPRRLGSQAGAPLLGRTR